MKCYHKPNVLAAMLQPSELELKYDDQKTADVNLTAFKPLDNTNIRLEVDGKL